MLLFAIVYLVGSFFLLFSSFSFLLFVFAFHWFAFAEGADGKATIITQLTDEFNSALWIVSSICVFFFSLLPNRSTQIEGFYCFFPSLSRFLCLLPVLSNYLVLLRIYAGLRFFFSLLLTLSKCKVLVAIDAF